MKKNSKIIKKIKKNDSQKPNYRGKPSNLKFTELSIPNIWTNQYQCVQIIKILTQEGRHLSCHLAGKHSISENHSQKYKEIKDTQIYYEYAQEVVEKLFKINCVSKRCIVFFFRNPNEEQQQIQNYSENINNYNYFVIFNHIKTLLSQTFIYDLISILNNESQIQIIVDELFNHQDQPCNYSQIIQNFFIKQKIQKMIQEKKQKSSIEVVKQEFEFFLKDQNSRYQVTMFIEEILKIFQATSQFQIGLPEYYQIDELDNDDG
ncbi:unnamed protein product [Paramecium sonneborni]|uniref:Uncharacterized protein n=1 Tax=Paramecium sonneborni TaxID=65129 RepID=A0A8S1MVS4_9CILI|nr:unnamed protein product [Paramecium sonneborni]